SQLAPMTTSYLTHLQAAGIPQQLADTIAAEMGVYGVKESYLAPGDRIWGEEMGEKFLLGPVAEESGCLLTALLAGSITAALIGNSLRASPVRSRLGEDCRWRWSHRRLGRACQCRTRQRRPPQGYGPDGSDRARLPVAF